MSTLRMVERTFAPGRNWYSLVDVVTDRVVCGGLRSETEAEQWATGEGHILSNPPARKSGATKTGPSSPPPEGSPRAASIVAPDPSSAASGEARIVSWLERAACKGKNPAHWFRLPAGNQYQPISKSRQENDPYAYARGICAECPVKTECGDYAIKLVRQGETVVGMWGGRDELDRAGRSVPARRAS